MKKNMIIRVLSLVVVLVAVIVLIGFTNFNSSTNQSANKITTYNDGVIIFNYPSNMTNSTGNSTGDNGYWNYTSSLTDNTTSILVGKTSTYNSPNASSSSFISYLTSSNGLIISNITTATNNNGVKVYKFAYKLNGSSIPYYEMDFANKNNSTVYSINIFGPNQNQIQIIENQIFNSLKLN